MYKIKQLQTKIKILISLISLVASKIECAGRQLNPIKSEKPKNLIPKAPGAPFLN